MAGKTSKAENLKEEQPAFYLCDWADAWSYSGSFTQWLNNLLKYNFHILLTFKEVCVLREAMSLEPFFNLSFFPFLPPYFPEEDPRHWAEEEGQEEAAVHLTIFQP